LEYLVGPQGLELNSVMEKLQITPKRLAANRKNSIKGGAVLKSRALLEYNTNPPHCKYCSGIIPYEKRKINQFCSQSCAATFNNTGQVRRKNPLNSCQYCGNLCERKYCSVKCSAEHRRKYSLEEVGAIKKTQIRETSANYRAKLRNQTPADADRKAIRSFYENCPKGYEVDHIIPISKGGLHTLENLQYLTISENRRKGNKI